MGDDDADPRVAWLAEKVCASLGCDVESFTSLMREDADAETKSAIEAYLAGARRSSACHLFQRPSPRRRRSSTLAPYRRAIPRLRRARSLRDARGRPRRVERGRRRVRAARSRAPDATRGRRSVLCATARVV
jgi:hypothetical protein